jgi:hypothetical protein
VKHAGLVDPATGSTGMIRLSTAAGTALAVASRAEIEYKRAATCRHPSVTRRPGR